MKKKQLRNLVKQCIAEVITEAQPPQENWEDTFGQKIPEPYINLEDITNEPMSGPHDVFVIRGKHAGKYLSAKQDKQGIYHYTDPKTGRTEPIGTDREVQRGHAGLIGETDLKKKDKVSAGERNQISKTFSKNGLDGNRRFEKVEAGLGAVTNALDEMGLQLDMVSKDLIMGEKGSRNFIYRRKNEPGQDPFIPQPEIQNSRIVFSWENLASQGQPPKFEILAYAS